MSQSLTQVILHIVFSTKDRHPFLRDPDLRSELHRYLGGIINGRGCQPLSIGGVEDHVHLLCAIGRTCTIADLVKEVKRSSTPWIRTRGAGLGAFAWQNGYGAFSIGYSQLDDVRGYVARQEEHHRHATFQEELRKLLERYHVPYDERYLWD